MMCCANLASSRAVTFRLGSGSPVALVKFDLVRPISRARALSISANVVSFPAMPSASAMQASLPDWMISPLRRSITFTLLWIAANMDEPCEGAPPLRQAEACRQAGAVQERLRQCEHGCGLLRVSRPFQYRSGAAVAKRISALLPAHFEGAKSGCGRGWGSAERRSAQRLINIARDPR